MNRIDAGLPPSAFSSTTSQAAPQNGQQQVGTMLGQAATAVDGEVSLADSAEELSLHMAEKTEDKHHAERKIGRDAPLQMLSAEAIVAYLAESHDADAQEKLIELARHLLAGQADPRQAAARAFGDAAGYEESLMKTPGGKYFLYGVGGPESPYAAETIVRLAAAKAEAWQNA